MITNTHDLFAQIAGIQPTLEGWCELEKASVLAAAVLTLRPEVIVEIGVFGGKSIIPIALACDAIGAGTVIGIDPWNADAAIEGYTDLHKDWWGSIDLDSIYDKFCSTLRALGLESRVQIWRDRSDDVAPPSVIDLLHVDGQHTDQAVRDVERFASKVRIGGLCCMDDIGWEGGGVQRAVEALHTLGFIRLYELGTGAMFQRTHKSRVVRTAQ